MHVEQSQAARTPADYVHDTLVGWMEEHDGLALRELRMNSRSATTRVLLAWMADNHPGELWEIGHEDGEAIYGADDEDATDYSAMAGAVAEVLEPYLATLPTAEEVAGRLAAAAE